MSRLRRAPLLAIAALVIAAAPSTAMAASYTTADGYVVRVEAPNLPADPARDQSFVDLLGSLAHGTELGLVTLHLAANEAEIASTCGPSSEFFACVTHDTIHAPGWISAAQQRVVLAHEYGHIIHSNRENPPRNATTDGTKRWASYEGICQGLRSGVYGEASYPTRPREAFAQAYATLNFPETPWFFVESLRPDAGALEAIRQDVLNPWAPTTEVRRGRITGGRHKASFQLSLPLDGDLTVKLKSDRGLSARLALIVGGRRIKGRLAKLSRGRSVYYEICGERTALLRVIAPEGSRGKFKVKITRP